MKTKLYTILPLVLISSLSAQSSQLTPVKVYDEALYSEVNSRTSSTQSYKPLGLEGVTGLRSKYIYRGRELADELLEFQLHGMLDYGDSKFLEYGLWHAGELGKGDLTETGILLNYIEQHGKWTYGVGGKYRHLEQSAFDSGLEANFLTRYEFSKDSILSGEVSYDTGAEGFYAKVEYDYYIDLSTRSYVSLNGGISFSADYYEEIGQDDDSNGFNDLFARATYTYNFTQQVSLSSFIGTSILEDSATLYAGVWFETSF